MAKSDKLSNKITNATLNARVDDVGRLMVLGAGLAEIRQFSVQRGWKVSDRQLRRYQDAAFKKQAKALKSDRRQNLGLHLQQRRALYAHCMKEGDHRTALMVLRDQAELQGLYPAADRKSGPRPEPVTSPLSRRERTIRLLVAEDQKDRDQLGLLQHATPYFTYVIPDTMIPQQMLHILTLNYVAEQLDLAARCMDAMICDSLDTPENADSWAFVALGSAYRYRVGRDGWLLFVQGLGLPTDLLVRLNHPGDGLEMFDEKICGFAPSEAEVRDLFAKFGRPDVSLATPASLARGWRDAFEEVCPG